MMRFCRYLSAALSQTSIPWRTSDDDSAPSYFWPSDFDRHSIRSGTQMLKIGHLENCFGHFFDQLFALGIRQRPAHK